MGPVRKYFVTHNGHRTIMRLNDQDVKAYPGAELVSAAPDGASGKARQPANKTRTATAD